MTLSAGFGRWLIGRGCKPADTHTVRDPDVIPIHNATAPPEDVMRNFTFNDLLKEGNAKQIWGHALMVDGITPAWDYFRWELAADYSDKSPAAVEAFVMRTAAPGTMDPPNKTST